MLFEYIQITMDKESKKSLFHKILDILCNFSSQEQIQNQNRLF